jgi:hypothetical protein
MESQGVLSELTFAKTYGKVGKCSTNSLRRVSTPSQNRIKMKPTKLTQPEKDLMAALTNILESHEEVIPMSREAVVVHRLALTMAEMVAKDLNRTERELRRIKAAVSS